MNDDLVTFLAARLDEDEANARDAQVLWSGTHFTIDPGSLVLVEFHRRRNPARVLREAGAKRAVLAEHRCDDMGWCTRCQTPLPGAREDEDRFAVVNWPCPTVRITLAVWSDHPDYRQEWAP